MEKFVIISVSDVLSGMPQINQFDPTNYDSCAEAISHIKKNNPNAQYLIVKKIGFNPNTGVHQMTRIEELIK